jgi:deoxyribonuclease V
MRFETLHDWDLTPGEARALQKSLSSRVDVTTPLPPWKTVAAADVSYNKYSEWLYAAVVVVEAGTFALIERAGVVAEARFPYVPGLLSFREAPPVLDAFARLQARPDVVLCDGQGIAHPRRIGLASHLGLWLGLPTIGCAKSLLCGEYDEPGPDRGDRSPLIDKGEVIGSVVRTRSRVNPLYVSPGHLCDLDGAISVVLATSVKYRLPVPSRMAHDYVNELRRAADTGQTPPV